MVKAPRLVPPPLPCDSAGRPAAPFRPSLGPFPLLCAITLLLQPRLAAADLSPSAPNSPAPAALERKPRITRGQSFLAGLLDPELDLLPEFHGSRTDWLCRAQQSKEGGWITDYRNGDPVGLANVETTCLALLALEAQLGAPVAADRFVSPPTFHRGMCDASAAVALQGDLFAVGNDEDNTLRIYHAKEGGPPVQSLDLSGFLKVDPRFPESDLEGGAWLGDRIFWITSHGRNRDGKFRETRHRFFATSVQTTHQTTRLVPVGEPYPRLLSDLLRDPQFKTLKLSGASKRPPKDRGGLNIEGLCATPDGHLLIGFRNPIPFGLALIVPLLNPNQVIAGQTARFGSPVLLNLRGQGIRDLGLWHGKYLIVAGSPNMEGVSKVYLWPGGRTEPELLDTIDLHEFNPEAVVVYPGNTRSFQLLSDDGTQIVDGVPCKRLPNPMLRRFRSVWVTPP